MSQEVLLTVINSMALLGESVNMDGKRKESCNLKAELLKSQNAFNDLLKRYSQLEKHYISLEASIQLNQEIFQKDESCDNQNALEISNFFENNDLKAQLQLKASTICKLKDIIKSMREKSKEENGNYDYCKIETKNVELENSVTKLLSENERLCNEINHVKHVFKEHFDSIKKTRVHTKEQIDSLIDKLNLKSAENEDLKAQIQDKVSVITSLKNDLQKIKGKEIVDIVAQIPSANTIVLVMFKLDLEPLAPRYFPNAINLSATKVVCHSKNKFKNVRIDCSTSSGIKATGIKRLIGSRDHQVGKLKNKVVGILKFKNMRMRQYICHTDHKPIDVIVNGDLEEEPAPTGETSAPPAPKTAKQLVAKRNQTAKIYSGKQSNQDPSVLRYHALKNKYVSIAQARRNMITYLKNQRGYKESYFKRMSYNDIRPIFERVWDHVNTFIPIGSEVEKDSSKPTKEKMKEKETTDYEEEKDELRMWLTVVPDEEAIVDPEVLHTKFPIVDWESQSLGNMHVYKIIRADGNTSYHKTFEIDHEQDDDIWKNKSQWKLISWKLYEICGVHTLMVDDTFRDFILVCREKYPLTPSYTFRRCYWKLEAEARKVR
ncbi:hypothetical protein Tco_0660205 [Tanacetum coccineum]